MKIKNVTNMNRAIIIVLIAMIGTSGITVATAEQNRYPIKVGVIQFGDMYNNMNPQPAIEKWKEWLEANSKFDVTVEYAKYPQLDSSEIRQLNDGTSNYFVYPSDLNDYHKSLLPKDTTFNFVLWNNEGKQPEYEGLEFGYIGYNQYYPFISIAIGMWWDSMDTPTWTYTLTSEMSHESENAMYSIVTDDLKLQGMKTPEQCTQYGFNNKNDWIECRTYILSTITDEMYKGISDLNPNSHQEQYEPENQPNKIQTPIVKPSTPVKNIPPCQDPVSLYGAGRCYGYVGGRLLNGALHGLLNAI